MRAFGPIQFWRRTGLLHLAGLGMLASGSLAAQALPEHLWHDDHVREEFGINEFTAPSVQKIFEDLDLLGPLPVDLAEGRRPPESFPGRDRLALHYGSLIADGFFAVQLRRRESVERIARDLVRNAHALGVRETVLRHSKALLEKAQGSDWDGLRLELARAEAQVEATMMELRDEETAHLISLGGWLRAMEVYAGVVLEDYSPGKAARLVRPEVADYFIDRIETLHPRKRNSPLYETIAEELIAIRGILEKTRETGIRHSEVEEIQRRVGAINAVIGQPE